MKKNAARRFLAGFPILLFICSLIFISYQIARADDLPPATEAPALTEAPVVLDAPAFIVAAQPNNNEDHDCKNNEEWDELTQTCVKKEHGQPTDSEVSASQTPNPSHDGTPDPCLTPGNGSECGNGDHGQGNPTVGSGHANCNADQGEVDPSCTPTAIATTPPAESTNTSLPTFTPVATQTNEPTPTASCFEVLGFFFGDCPATVTPVPTVTAVQTNTALPTTTFIPSPTATLIAMATSTNVVIENESGESSKAKFCLFEVDVTPALVDDINGDGYNDVVRYWRDGYGKKTAEINLSGTLAGEKSWPAADNCFVTFVNTDASGQSDIWTVGSKGGGLVRITNDATPEGHLDFRDGKLVFTDLTNGIIHSINMDGTGDTMLTAGHDAVVLPSNFMVYGYNNTIWGYDQNGVAKDSHVVGTPVAWTYSCLVISNNGTLTCYNFATQQSVPVSGLDFVGQPNATKLQGLFTDNATLSLLDPNSPIFAAYSPDWFRWDAKSDGAIETFFAGLPQ